MSTLQYHGMLSRIHDERGTCRHRMRARHDFLLVLRVCMSEEVSTDKATWQASMATTIRIHQCRGLCLRFVHIIDHKIACVMYWLSVLYGLFHCVASRSGVPLDVFSPCGVSRHPPSAQPRVVPCGGTFVPCARSCVSCGGVPGIQPDPRPPPSPHPIPGPFPSSTNLPCRLGFPAFVLVALERPAWLPGGHPPCSLPQTLLRPP